MKPIPINALGSVDFFTLTGDTVDQVKVKLASDIPSSVDPAIQEHIANIQFGVFYTFLNSEDELAATGKIFRAGMSFMQRQLGGGRPDDGPRKPPDDPEPPQPDPKDEELMRPVKDIEKLLKDDG